ATAITEIYTLSLHDALPIFKPKFKRLKAALLALFLGHFGVHRIYLGTSPNVPIVYSLTLGGGLGLLPLADFIFILTSKDLEAFRSEEHTSELQSRENLVCRL